MAIDENDDANDYYLVATDSIDVVDAYDFLYRSHWHVQVFQMRTICDRAEVVALVLDDDFDVPSMGMALAVDDVFAADDEN